ncbi:sulfite dehydrogenase [Geminicoccaceae bacterium 1502E]|nr:sulfite dehydrogenase [Geminicoccaceae bacterium 1502E]
MRLTKEQEREIEARRLAEARLLAERREAARQDEECECREGMFPAASASRRGLLSGGSAMAGAAVAALLQGRTVRAEEAPAGAVLRDVPEDPTKMLGEAVAADGGYGSRSQFETEVRWRYPTANEYTSWSMTPLQDSLGNLTPSGLHFERHHGGIPTIDPARHTLFVHGMVDKARKFSMEDIRRFPSVTRKHFIECSGNGLTEWKKPTLKTVQGTHGLLSTSEWTGVLFSTIAREVGIDPDAAWVLAEGADAAVMTRSIPMEKMLQDAILAYGQNGEAIRPEQGYPLRLLLPGFEGNTHIKWLRRLVISDKPFMTREETSKYTDLLPDGRARQFSLEMDAKSVITFPSGDMRLPRPGFYTISGLAWSGRGRIQSVEVSVDGGKSWQPAQLDTTPEPVCTVRFSLPWAWDGKPAVLQSRCTDETGYVQPRLDELVALRGTSSIYHLNAIQSWAVAADGSVSNVHA